MGVSASRALAPQPPIDPATLFQGERELERLVYVRSIPRRGAERLMKTYLCRLDGVEVEAQVYVKRRSDEELRGVAEALERLYRLLDPAVHPNVVPTQHWFASTRPVARNAGTPAFLLRQHLATNLYDRLSTRPFLSNVEKSWVVYQVFRALEVVHDLGLVHGDLTSEAIYITTFGWVVLSDFAPYKPTYLPDDDPADFNFFFQQQNRACYLAPERFFSSSPEARGGKDIAAQQQVDDLMNPQFRAEKMLAEAATGTGPKTGVGGGGYLTRDGQLRSTMDVWSLGCIISEVYSDVGPPLDLPALLRLRTAGTPEEVASLLNLSRLDKQPAARRLVRDMCALAPGQRQSVRDNRERFIEENLGPAAFETFLYPLFQEMVLYAPGPDDKLSVLCAHYSRILKELTGAADPVGAAFFTTCADVGLGNGGRLEPRLVGAAEGQVPNFRDHVLPFAVPRAEPAGSPESATPLAPPEGKSVAQLVAETQALIAALEAPMPEQPPARVTATPAEPLARPPNPALLREGGVIIVVQLLCSTLRHLRTPQARLVALRLLTRLSGFLPPPMRLQRVLPFVLHALDDERPAVRAGAVRALHALLESCDALAPGDARVFPRYIFPSLGRVAVDPAEMVRVAFAESLAGLAEAAKRFLDLGQAMAHRPEDENDDAGEVIPGPEGGDDMDNWTQRQMKAQVLRQEMGGVVDREARSAGAEPLATPRSRGRRRRGSLQLGAELMDKELHELQEQVIRWIVSIAAPPASLGSDGGEARLAKRALLRDIPRFCLFLGPEKMLSTMLPHLIHVFNDKDWQLRFSFCQYIPAVCALVGSVATGIYILPFLETALTDGEERVVARALRSMATLVELGFLPRHQMLDKAQETAPLLLHPSRWVHGAAVVLQSAVAQSLGFPDQYVFSLPVLRPYLRHDLLGVPINPSSLSLALLPPVSRAAFTAAVRKVRRPTTVGSPDSDSKGDAEAPPHEPMALQKLERYVSATASGVRKAPPSAPTAPSTPDAFQRARADVLGSVRGAGFALREQPERLLVPAQRIANALCEDSFGLVELPHLQKLYYRLMGHAGRRSGSARSLDLNDDLTQWQVDGGPDHLSRVELEDLQSVLDLRLASGLHPGRLRSPWERPSETLRAPSRLPPPPGPPPPMLMPQPSSSFRTTFSEPPPGDASHLARRVRSLGLPPLPPTFGVLRHPKTNAPYSAEQSSSAALLGAPPTPRGAALGSAPAGGGRPSCPGVLITSFAEHTGAVNALCVSQDQRFFVSCGEDGTSRVWATRHLDKRPVQRAQAVYDRQRGPILAAVSVEDSHSIASASADGTVHVWRVDFQRPAPSLPPGTPETGEASGGWASSRVEGTSMVRAVQAQEGGVTALAHFNQSVASMLLFGTQRGVLHGWDLRAAVEPFSLCMPPGAGLFRALAVGPDRHWVLGGTSRGFLALWDLRFGTLVNLWRHSSGGPIHRVANASTTINAGLADNSAERPLAYVAAGANEVACFDLVSGRCRQCFRVLPPLGNGDFPGPGRHIGSAEPQSQVLPRLEALRIPNHPRAPLDLPEGFATAPQPRPEPSVRALLGRLAPQASYLVTAGTDCAVRFWDFQSAQRCGVVAGLRPGQPRPYFDASANGDAQLYVCRDTALPPPEAVMPSKLPIQQQKGPLPPFTGHQDAVLDLKALKLPLRCVLSASRDGVVKAWK